MANKPKLNQPDVETTTTFSATGESLTINMTIPTKQFKDIFVTGTSVINQQPNNTFSECIKEWEELQCDVIVWESQERYEISNRDETIYFEILTIGNNYVVDNHCCEFVKPQVIHLLSKTLKALEEMKNENN